jgi:hypothetical protein
MAYSLNGFGTTFYGERDHRADGTYITTEWITAFYIPLIPLRSFRLGYRGPAQSKSGFGFGSAESYAVFEKTRPNGKQVLSVYGFLVFCAAWLILTVRMLQLLYPNGLKDHGEVYFALAVAVLGPISIPFFLRRRARKRAVPQ